MCTDNGRVDDKDVNIHLNTFKCGMCCDGKMKQSADEVILHSISTCYSMYPV